MKWHDAACHSIATEGGLCFHLEHPGAWDSIILWDLKYNSNSDTRTAYKPRRTATMSTTPLLTSDQTSWSYTLGLLRRVSWFWGWVAWEDDVCLAPIQHGKTGSAETLAPFTSPSRWEDQCARLCLYNKRTKSWIRGSLRLACNCNLCYLASKCVLPLLWKNYLTASILVMKGPHKPVSLICRKTNTIVTKYSFEDWLL